MLAEDAVGVVDLVVGPVAPEVGVAAAVAALEAAGFQVTLTADALVVRSGAGDPGAALVDVADPASPRTRCPGTASRRALGPVSGPGDLQLYGARQPARDGLPAGLRLSGVRPGGAVAVLGFRSGDVVESVEGAVSWAPDQGVGGLAAALVTLTASGEVAEVRVRRRGAVTRWSCRVD